jgi:uncharacterized repeat protein (TIGR02543 family)
MIARQLKGDRAMGKQSEYLLSRVNIIFGVLFLGIVLLFTGCGGGGGGSPAPSGSTHNVVYSGNGNTGGTAPTDSTKYQQDNTVTVLGNTGSLVRTGYTFAGWNTKYDGSGTAYAAGATFTMGSADIVLYAQWTSNSAGGQVTTVYSFGASTTDGQQPFGGVMLGSDGYLYGTTHGGGPNGTGTVFKLSTTGTESVLYSFGPNGGAGGDSRMPIGGVVMDSSGNLWGTATYGGTGGNGTVFEISPSGAETLYVLGGTPTSTLIVDAAGDVWGTTPGGGTYGSGSVFKISGGVVSTLYSFVGSAGTPGPFAGLITDGAGNFYGTTEEIGQFGHGEVFQITAAGVESTIYAFTSRTEGFDPSGLLARDSAGNLYGTTYGGGAYDESGSYLGTVFKISPSGTKTTLYSFGQSANDGETPYGSVILDSSGNLYGTTEYGGAYGDGTLFRISSSGVMSTLHSFGATATDGQNPSGAIVMDNAGNIYGTTTSGGANGKGTVFKYH